MSLHPTKTKCMLIGSKYNMKVDKKFNLIINGLTLENVSKQRVLGVLIDNKQTWQSQIDYVCKELNKKIALFKRISFYLTTEIILMFYNSYILPILDYCCIIWGESKRHYVNKVSVLQKRIA